MTSYSEMTATQVYRDANPQRDVPTKRVEFSRDLGPLHFVGEWCSSCNGDDCRQCQDGEVVLEHPWRSCPECFDVAMRPENTTECANCSKRSPKHEISLCGEGPDPICFGCLGWDP